MEYENTKKTDKDKLNFLIKKQNYYQYNKNKDYYNLLLEIKQELKKDAYKNNYQNYQIYHSMAIYFKQKGFF
jgi:hypothetical protein